MATSSETKSETTATVGLPEGVSANFEDSSLTVTGPLGSSKKDFSRMRVKLESRDGKVCLTPFGSRKHDLAVLNTVKSHVENMVLGVTKGLSYRLKVVYAHFPINVRVKGSNVLIENFYGERSPRVAKIVGDCKVSVEGDDIIVRGVSIEDVGQTAANIEQATTIRRKDSRVFLDGIYVYEKSRG